MSDEFRDWYEALDEEDQEVAFRCVERLEQAGVALGDPFSSAIKGSQYALRELKSTSRTRPLRILYAFDPKRQAVLLVGGDKTGDKRFYEWIIPVAERLWEEHLAELK